VGSSRFVEAKEFDLNFTLSCATFSQRTQTTLLAIMKFKAAASGVFSVLVSLCAHAQMVFNVTFDSPAYTLGALDGQDNWTRLGGWANVTDLRAHSGTQSIVTWEGGAGVTRPPENGPLNPVNGSGWWMETWAYFPTSDGNTHSLFTMGGGVVSPPFILVYGDGEVHFGGTTSTIRNLGSSILDKWVRLRIHQTGTQGSSLRFSITGSGVNEVVDNFYATSYTPNTVTLSVFTKTPFGPLSENTKSYWDDMRAGYGAVPEPASFATVGALAGLGFVIYRRRSA
jgi:hypothetical protein